MSKVNLNRILKYQLLGMLLIVGLAVYFGISTYNYINRCELVKAKITDVKFEKGYGDDNDEYHLSLLVLINRKTITGIKYDTGFTDPEFKVGQIVELYYDMNDPYNSEIKNLWKQWAVPLVLALALIIELIFIAVFYTVFAKIGRNKE